VSVLLLLALGAILIALGIVSGRPEQVSCPPGFEPRTVRVQAQGRVPYWKTVTRCVAAG
jgi:hypothetical protein